MLIKKLTLGFGLLFMGIGSVQAETYKVRPGDTISEIAERCHVKTREMLRANGLGQNPKLKIGSLLIVPRHSDFIALVNKLDMPAARPHPVSLVSLKLSLTGHTWSAKAKPVLVANSSGKPRLTILAAPLLPPPSLTDPYHPTSKPAHEVVASHTSASKPLGTAKPALTRAYHVRPGENDWIIARRLEIAPSALRRLNPGVQWDSVQVGQAIQIPSAVAAKANVPQIARIRSRYAVVARDSVTIRRAPKTSAPAVTIVPSGVKVIVLDRDGDWYNLKFPKGTTGWVRGDLLKASSAPKEVLVARRRRRQRVQSLVAAKPRRHRGRTVEDVMPATSSAVVGTVSARILNNAAAMRGTRYSYGSMSRSATDCSGFTSQVFRRNGFRLPRTSAAQSQVGQKVGKDGLKPGDLVFFHTRRGRRVSHVGIYMGQGKFIHASSGGHKVQVNSLSDGYYRQRFVTARRVVKKK